MSQNKSKRLKPAVASNNSRSNGPGEGQKPPKKAKISKIFSQVLFKEKLQPSDVQRLIDELQYCEVRTRFCMPVRVTAVGAVMVGGREDIYPLGLSDVGHYDVSNIVSPYPLRDVNSILAWWYVARRMGIFHSMSSEEAQRFGQEFWEFQIHPLGGRFDDYFFVASVYDRVKGKYFPLIFTVSGRTFPIEWYDILREWYGGSAMLKEFTADMFREASDRSDRRRNIISWCEDHFGSGLEDVDRNDDWQLGD